MWEGILFFQWRKGKLRKWNFATNLLKKFRGGCCFNSYGQISRMEKKGQQENIKHPELSHISLFPNAIFALNAISYITLYDT